MKNRFVPSLVLLISTLLWNTSRANSNLNSILPESNPTETICEALPVPDIDIRVCLNAGPVAICVTLRCDLHWTDIIQPGLGQLFGHKGCHKLVGQSAASNGQSVTEFEGTSEDMIQAIEKSMKVPRGSLQSLKVTLSPTFPLPDGNDYRVIAKTYPVLQGDTGRYLPLEVEKVN